MLFAVADDGGTIANIMDNDAARPSLLPSPIPLFETVASKESGKRRRKAHKNLVHHRNQVDDAA